MVVVVEVEGVEQQHHCLLDMAAGAGVGTTTNATLPLPLPLRTLLPRVHSPQLPVQAAGIKVAVSQVGTQGPG